MRRILVVIALLAINCGPLFRTNQPALPLPTGPHSIGRASFHWVDSHRAEVITEAASDYRELLVYIWYPAVKVEAPSAAYLPNVKRLLGTAAVSTFSNLFGPSWPAIRSDALQSHSFDKAPIVPTGELPILIFSPGGGGTAIAYTRQIEELASHGYIVVGVEHTYDAPAVVFPDGRVLASANDFWARLRHELSDSESFEKRVTDMLAADIVFVIDKLGDLSRDQSSAFYLRLDMARIGVFGHSRGGRTAARVCQLDRRVKACLNQDGNWSWHPFWLDENGRSMEQPFLMLDHRDPELPVEVFAKMGTTRELYVQNRSARQAEAGKRLYGTVSGGSYHVTISTPGISHNSFLDTRLLGRPDGESINLSPKDVQASTPHARILHLITTFTRAFFDEYVRGIPTPLLNAATVPEEDVEVLRYGTAAN